MLVVKGQSLLTDDAAEHRFASDDYTAFNEVWDKPDGGMHRYLYNFLTSVDATFQHIAVWTIVQLLESNDRQLINSIRNSNLLIPSIRQLSASHSATPTPSVGTPRSHHSQTQSYDDTETAEGQGEIKLLSRRILDLVEREMDSDVPRSVAGSHMGGSSVGSSSGRDHEELRRSVREAFSSAGSHH